MERVEIINKILEYFKENESVYNDCIQELDDWNGFLGDDRYYPMDELDELFCGQDATYILQRAFFGYDAETWHTDGYGNKEYGAFNPNRTYFTFNGYGNLVSADYKDYSAFCDEYAVEEMAKLYDEGRDLCAVEDDEELSALFALLGEGGEDEE